MKTIDAAQSSIYLFFVEMLHLFLVSAVAVQRVKLKLAGVANMKRTSRNAELCMLVQIILLSTAMWGAVDIDFNHRIYKS